MLYSQSPILKNNGVGINISEEAYLVVDGDIVALDGGEYMNNGFMRVQHDLINRGGTHFFEESGEGELIFSGDRKQFMKAIDSIYIPGGLTVNKSLGTNSKVHLTRGNASVGKVFNLKNGVLKSSDTSFLTLSADITIMGASDSSFVEGPLARVTDTVDLFDFPVGNNSSLRNVSVAPVGNKLSRFKITFVDSAHPVDGVDATLNELIVDHYWWVNQLNSSGEDSIHMELTWNKSDSIWEYINSLEKLKGAWYRDSVWTSAGNLAQAGDTVSGKLFTSLISLDTVQATQLPVSIAFISTFYYAVLKKNLDAGYFNSYWGRIPFKYRGEYNEGELRYKVYDESRTVRMDAADQSLLTQYGDNRFNLWVGCALGNDEGFFVLEIKKEKGMKRKLRFKYEKPIVLPCNIISYF